LNSDKKEFVHPPHLDEFFLGSASLNSAASDNPSLWKNIWEKTRRVFYVRRPIRVAETQVSAIVLATGDYEELKNSGVLQQQLSAAQKSIVQMEQKLAQTIAEKQTVMAAGELLQQQINTLNTELEKVRAELIALQENSIPNTELAAAQQQIADLTQQLELAQKTLETAQKQLANAQAQVQGTRLETHQLRQFVVSMLEPQPVKWESLDLLAKLRAPADDGAQEAMKKLLEALSQDGDSQQLLVQLLTLMPAVHDALNWPSLLFTFEQQQFKALREHLRVPEPVNFPELMLKFADSVAFPAELHGAWKKLTQQLRRRGG
jgi:myosin heavy subunit